MGNTLSLRLRLAWNFRGSHRLRPSILCHGIGDGGDTRQNQILSNGDNNARDDLNKESIINAVVGDNTE